MFGPSGRGGRLADAEVEDVNYAVGELGGVGARVTDTLVLLCADVVDGTCIFSTQCPSQ